MIIKYMKAEIPNEESSKLEEGITHINRMYKQQDRKTSLSSLYYKTGTPLQLISILVIAHSFAVQLVGFPH